MGNLAVHFEKEILEVGGLKGAFCTKSQQSSS